MLDFLILVGVEVGMRYFGFWMLKPATKALEIYPQNNKISKCSNP